MIKTPVVVVVVVVGGGGGGRRGGGDEDPRESYQPANRLMVGGTSAHHY